MIKVSHSNVSHNYLHSCISFVCLFLSYTDVSLFISTMGWLPRNRCVNKQLSIAKVLVSSPGKLGI